MKSKKGDLRDNFVDIVIGVLCLILIIIAIVLVYNVLSNQEDKNAKNLLSNLEGKINALDEGQNSTMILQGFKGATGKKVTDETWFLIGWSNNELGSPQKCAYESCICLCKDELEASKQNLAVKCDNHGFCDKFNEKNIKVNTNWMMGIYAGDKSEYIRLANNLLQVNISKTKDIIKVQFDDQSIVDYGIFN